MKSGHSINSGHFVEVVDHAARTAAIEYVCGKLENVQFDSVAVSGYSAATIGAIVAHAMGKSLVIVRKQCEKSHSNYAIEGNPGRRFVIVDDFIDSGATVRRIESTILEHSTISTECAGFCGYSRAWWRSIDKAERLERCENDAGRILFLG